MILFFIFLIFLNMATSMLTQREELIKDFEMCVLIAEHVENKFFEF
jgi:hypothetical protein